MPLPVRSLPVVQHWDCGACADCCRTYHVRVNDVEKARLDEQNWDDTPELAGVARTVWDESLKAHRLNHRADGACVFLGPDNRCRIHAKYGSAAKPMACRIYPFILVPAGDHWRVSLRYACPATVANAGRPLTDHASDLREYAGLQEADIGGPPPDRTPELNPGQPIARADLLRFLTAFDTLLADDTAAIDLRLRRLAALARQCRPLKYDTVTGTRLKEFLEVMAAAVLDEVPLEPTDVEPPGWVGRTLFRQIVAVYSRKDTGPHPGIASRSRWTRIQAAWRFARGIGPIPRLHALLPEATFEQAELPGPALDADCTDLLTRYYRVKLGSLQFCGPTYFGWAFWDGLDALLLTYPVIRWLGRVLSSGGTFPPDEALTWAVRMVDEHFGYNPLLGAGRQAWAVRSLGERDELGRLMAWYSRSAAP